MNGTRCKHIIHADLPPLYGDGRCSRFVPYERAKLGDTLCSVHDPKCKAQTKAAHLVRMQARYPKLPNDMRERLIIEIKELTIWWDGPGSEGREV